MHFIVSLKGNQHSFFGVKLLRISVGLKYGSGIRTHHFNLMQNVIVTWCKISCISTTIDIDLNIIDMNDR